MRPGKRAALDKSKRLGQLKDQLERLKVNSSALGRSSRTTSGPQPSL